MSAYTDHVGLFEPAGGILYRTTAPILWELWRKGSGDFFTVPADTLFEVSVPAPLRWLFSPHDKRFLKGAALHDEMLKAGIDRLRAAAEFNIALRADGVGTAKRLAMFLAVALWKFR